MTANSELATAARALADAETGGSLTRRAALCVAVCLQTTKTLAGARTALTQISPGPVREAAADLFDNITGEQRIGA